MSLCRFVASFTGVGACSMSPAIKFFSGFLSGIAIISLVVFVVALIVSVGDLILELSSGLVR